MLDLGAQMELWGPPQHNTVRECGYGPLETEKSSFGTTSESPDKKFFFFPRLWEWIWESEASVSEISGLELISESVS